LDQVGVWYGGGRADFPHWWWVEWSRMASSEVMARNAESRRRFSRVEDEKTRREWRAKRSGADARAPQAPNSIIRAHSDQTPAVNNRLVNIPQNPTLSVKCFRTWFHLLPARRSRSSILYVVIGAQPGDCVRDGWDAGTPIYNFFFVISSLTFIMLA
jgi:hypothetical protein